MSTKQVLVIRRDLGMRRGKECAQAAHASLAFLTRRLNHLHGTLYSVDLTDAQRRWLATSYKKVTLQVQTEAELRELHQRAVNAGIEAHLVTDSGLTEFDGVPTVTCLAIGPDHDERIDEITGSLPLY